MSCSLKRCLPKLYLSKAHIIWSKWNLILNLKLLLSTLCLHYPNPCDAYVSYFQVVSSTVYLKELEKLGINVNAKNFLVFQVQKASQ